MPRPKAIYRAPRRSSLRSARPPTIPAPLETQVYQAILERRPAQIIPRLKEILAKPDPTLGYINSELRFWLGWAQDAAGDHAGAEETWRQARTELESFLKAQPENINLISDLALTDMGLGDKAAALALSEWAATAVPIEKNAIDGPVAIEVLARVAARMGEPDRAIIALQKLLSIPYRWRLYERSTYSCADPARSDVRSAPERSAFPKTRYFLRAGRCEGITIRLV